MEHPDQETPSSADNPANMMDPSTPGIAASISPQTFKDASEWIPEEKQFSIKTFYECDTECGWCKHSDLAMAVENYANIKQTAIVMRMCKGNGEESPMVLDSVVIQSFWLKSTLSEVFEGYQGIVFSAQNFVFKRPFQPFYHRWHRFMQIVDRQKREQPNDALFSSTLFDVMQNEIGQTMGDIKVLTNNSLITFQLLWAIFEPGTRVISEEAGHERFYILKSCTHGTESMSFEVKSIDWDGEKFGYATDTFRVPYFTGKRKITDLCLYPEGFHPSLTKNKAKAIATGQKFWALRGIHHKAYSGFGQSETHHWRTRRELRNADCRVIVDAASYFHANPMDRETLGVLHSEATTRQTQVGNDQTSSPVTDLSEEQLLLCGTHVRGYSLKLKQWGSFDVDKITNIAWNDDAFQQLILPESCKNTVLSICKEQAASQIVFDDAIECKDVGLIGLLFGPPGTGKTLTVQAVADKVQRPLYDLSAEELGQDAREIKKRLGAVMDMVEKWNAILLFDECDLFLEKRSTSRLDHNQIFVVFLRALENFRGTMLMTTNRADMIDPAFESRTFTLPYYELDEDAKYHIWKHLISQSDPESTVHDMVYTRLSALPMNGHQIKNHVKFSALLAGQENMPSGTAQVCAHLMRII